MSEHEVQRITDLLPVRRFEPKGENPPAWWYCTNCGKRHVAMYAPKACTDCGGQRYFRNCNLVLVGKAKLDQMRGHTEWRRKWMARGARA